MFQLSEFLSPRPEPWWPLLRQVGIDHVVAMMRGGEQEQRMYASVGGTERVPDGADGVQPWSEEALKQDVGTFAEHGFTVAAVEDTPPLDAVRLGRPGRDEVIEQVLEQVRAMGRLEIPVLCYNWMVHSSWSRTRPDIPTRGGALVTGFSRAEAERAERFVVDATGESLWSALEYFLAAVLPVAREAGVRLALHPDDPPLPQVRGIPRIMSSVDAFRRLRGLDDSPANAITFCQGNFTLMTQDLPATIRELGDAIAFVHFRDVRGSAADFVETFHDDGQTDMPACLRAYQDSGFEGPMRPDHVPTMAGESNSRPGYEVLGRLFSAGYVRGLEQAIYGHPSVRDAGGSLRPARRS
ncbi:mannonate dehydratase [Ruania alkalisoli]|uniref:mannonate dehydratase n=1 Tax=Ruania alkalisoli TaxID=2779775 RepID=A0A7M1SUU4_9MICO|nr:mannonate dehydratase [Ruania alkalisoli]QOR70837.1 mannonate dehydratase [Ruania alkalisoli]